MWQQGQLHRRELWCALCASGKHGPGHGSRGLLDQTRDISHFHTEVVLAVSYLWLRPRESTQQRALSGVRQSNQTTSAMLFNSKMRKVSVPGCPVLKRAIFSCLYALDGRISFMIKAFPSPPSPPRAMINRCPGFVVSATEYCTSCSSLSSSSSSSSMLNSSSSFQNSSSSLSVSSFSPISS